MKINFITATMAGGGTERVISVLANYFIQKNYKVVILLLADSRVEYVLNPQIDVIQISELTGKKIKQRIKKIVNLKTFIKNNKQDIYLSFGTETNLFSIISSFMLSTKLIISERNDPNKCGYKMIRNLFYVFGKKFVFQTEDAKKCFSKKIQENSVIIPNPITDNLPSPFEGERKKCIVSVGRLEPQKNQKLLIKAFSKFLKQEPEYTLRIFGKGSLQRELEDEAKRLFIYDKVDFAGFSNDIANDIKDATMFVLSSDYEGISNSMLEALAMGIPVISTDCPCGGSKMMIENYVNGILVPVGDADGLCNAMLEVARNDEFAEGLSKEAVKVREYYSIEKICLEWEQQIDTVRK